MVFPKLEENKCALNIYIKLVMLPVSGTAFPDVFNCGKHLKKLNISGAGEVGRERENHSSWGKHFDNDSEKDINDNLDLL